MLLRAKKRLDQAKVRVTPIRLAALSVLARQKHPISVDELWAKIPGKSIDRVTLYRTMETLAKASLVRAVDLRHGHVDYEWNDPNDHHHHFVCQDCGQIENVQLKSERKIWSQLERDHGFRTTAHSLEVFGVCRQCQ